MKWYCKTYKTHWGQVTHICVAYLTIIGSDNGLSPSRHQAIIWTNAGILLIRPFGTNFSEILIKIHIFSFKKMHLKMSSAKRRPFCLGLNVITATEVTLWVHSTFSRLQQLQYVNNGVAVVLCWAINIQIFLYCILSNGVIFVHLHCTFLIHFVFCRWCHNQTGDATLVAITGTTKPVPYLLDKSLQLSWRLGTGRFDLRVPNLQMVCSDLTYSSDRKPV